MAENSSSSWDDLIKQLGAEPAPDALERKRSAIETSFQPPAVSAPPARAKGGDWNALAGELGIELPPEPEPPAPAAAPSPPQPPREAPVSRSAASLESTFAGIEPIESMFEEIIEEEIADVDFSEGDDFDDDDDDDETLDRRELQRPGLSGEAARSAFEALFEAGSFSALPPVQQPQSRPPAEARRGPDWRDFEEVGGDPSPVRVPSAEPTRPPSDEAADEDLSDEQNRPKRRRRRRRGRGRDRADASSADEPDAASAGPADSDEPWQQPLDDDDLSQEEAAADEGDDQLAGEEKRTRRRRPRRRHRKDGREADAPERPSPPSAHDDDDEDELQHEPPLAAAADDSHDDDSDDDDGDDEDVGRSAHKNMPTWSAAIGVIVETNMQARKTAPTRPSAPRGRGRGRGGRRGRS